MPQNVSGSPPFPSPAIFRRIRDALGKTTLPVLIYDLPTLRASVRAITDSFPDYYFPIKCNPHPAVLRAVKENGGGFSARSLGEVRQVLALDANSAKVSYTGWGLGPTVMKRLIRDNILVNLDSAREVRTWLAHFPKEPFGIRILAGKAPAYLNAGFTPEEVPGMLETILRAGGRLRTIQIHFPHEAATADEMIQDWSFLPGLLSAYLGEAIGALEWMNLGGGWPGAYDGGKPMDPAEVLAVIRSILQPALEKVGFSGRIAIEPGRFAAASGGWLAAEVVRVANGSRTEVTIAAPPPIPSERRAFPVLLLKAAREGLVPVDGQAVRCRLSGANPLPFSLIREEVWMPRPRVGDVALLGQAGAYMEKALNYSPAGIRVVELAVDE